jgi:uncharacterized protein (DUF58 family)
MIPAHVMRELRYLEISTPRAVRNARIGPYTSRSRGGGFDFDEHRPYRPGDDVRRIDWNVTARMNAPYLRQTHAERELDLIMVVDVSPSMQIGSGTYSKRDVTTFVTGSLLFSAAADQINAGFLAFSDRVLSWTPARHASGRAWRMLEDIWSIKADPAPTALLPAVRHLASMLKTMSIVVLISDFMTSDDAFGSSELRTLASRHDVIAVIVENDADTTVPATGGYMRVRDVESGRAMVIGMNERSRRAFRAAVADRRRRIVDGCHRLGMPFAFVRSEAPVMQPVLELFARRRTA